MDLTEVISRFIIFSDTKVEPASVSELKEQKVGFCYIVAKVLLNIIVICC